MSRNSRRAAAGSDSPMRAAAGAVSSGAARSSSSVRWNGASSSAMAAPAGPALLRAAQTGEVGLREEAMRALAVAQPLLLQLGKMPLNLGNEFLCGGLYCFKGRF